MPALTPRDGSARNLLPLLSLQAPRKTATEACERLPVPTEPPQPVAAPVAVTRKEGSVNGGMLPAILHSAMRQEILISRARRNDILAHVAGLGTRADALAYLAGVQGRLKAG